MRIQMVTFRCKRSGNTVKFSNPADIEGMRKHECYEEVVETTETPAFLQPVVTEEPKKRAGRPKKVV